MKKLKHTKAPITQANSTATMDKINEIIDAVDGMYQDMFAMIEKVDKLEKASNSSIHLLVDLRLEIFKLKKKVDKLEDEVSMKDE